MFDDDVRSYLTDEDRKEIAQEAFANGVELVIRQLKANGGVSIQTIASATGMSEEEIQAL